MRLSKEQAEIIKDAASRIFPGCSIFLFGSRADDSKKGGDIDLMLIGDRKYSISERRKLKIELLKLLGDRRIDIISYARNETNDFYELIKDKAIEL